MTASSPARSGQARRRARSRAALIGAAHELLGEGRREVSIEEIAKRAGVGFGTFYNHFESKDQLFEEAVLDVVDGYAAWIREASADLSDPAEVFARSFRLTMRLAGASPELLTPLLGAGTRVLMLQRDLQHDALQDLRQGVTEGRFVDIAPEVLLVTVGGALLGLTQLISTDPGAVSDADAARVVEGILRLLGVDPQEAAEIAHRPLPDAFDLTPAQAHDVARGGATVQEP